MSGLSHEDKKTQNLAPKAPILPVVSKQYDSKQKLSLASNKAPVYPQNSADLTPTPRAPAIGEPLYPAASGQLPFRNAVES